MLRHHKEALQAMAQFWWEGAAGRARGRVGCVSTKAQEVQGCLQVIVRFWYLAECFGGSLWSLGA